MTAPPKWRQTYGHDVCEVLAGTLSIQVSQPRNPRGPWRVTCAGVGLAFHDVASPTSTPDDALTAALALVAERLDLHIATRRSDRHRLQDLRARLHRTPTSGDDRG